MTVNSPKNLLAVTILIGFVSLLTGVIVGLAVYLIGWPTGLSALALGLAVLGLVFLIAAWHIRQGLVNGRFVRSIANLIKLPKTMKQKLKK